MKSKSNWRIYCW